MSEFDESWKDGKEHATGGAGGEYVQWNGTGWNKGYSFRYEKSEDEKGNKKIDIILNRTLIEKELQEKLDAQNLENQRLKDTIATAINPNTIKRANELLRDTKRGGGVTKLDAEHRGKAGEYSIPEEAMADLKARGERKIDTDYEALDQYQGLLKKSNEIARDVIEKGKQVYWVMCPRCSGVVNVGAGETVCSKCGREMKLARDV